MLTLTVMCAALACTSLDDFSTGKGQEYRGDIIQGKFVRKGFGLSTTLELTFHVDRADQAPDSTGTGGPGMVRTSDGRFEDALLEPIAELPHDQLSKLDFPGGRLRSYLFFARSSGVEQDLALVVISLMEDESVEVRIVRGGDDPLYGVFQTKKKPVRSSNSE